MFGVYITGCDSMDKGGLSGLGHALAAPREYHGIREYHVSPDSRRLLDHSGSGKVQPSPLPSEPFGVSARGLSQPKFGQQNEDGTSMPSNTPDVIMTLVSYFCGLPDLARKGP